MRRTVCLLAALLALPSLGSDAPKGYDGVTEFVGIEGTWRRVAVHVHGHEIPFQAEVRTYRQGRITWADGGGIVWTYTTDNSHITACLDEGGKDLAGKPQTRLCIYEVRGDTLRIGWRRCGDRPENFDDPLIVFDSPGLVIDTYKRVK
jgi:uncharacterized protein (TIGR03067 family)